MEQLVKSAQEGDAEAFGALADHVRRMAFAVAWERLRDVHLAQDVVQEALTEAYLKLSKLHEPAAFPGWFRTIVIRQCQRLQRRKALPQVQLEKARTVLPALENVEEAVERREEARILQEGVAALSSRLRLPVMMFYYYGYPLQDISAYLDIPMPVLKKRLFDARRKLRAWLPLADPAYMFNHMDEGGYRMLHIVNGDTVGDKLKAGIVQGEVLVWREIYSVGPVFGYPAGEAELERRAHVLGEKLGISSSEYMARCREQEQQLRECQKHDEVVLWFEHDLFDQSMLAYLLHTLKGHKWNKTVLSLLTIGQFPGIPLFHGLGQLTADQLSTLAGTWKSIGHKEMELGSQLWQAYASPDPLALATLLEQKREELHACSLPFAYEAFQAHLQRFPSVMNGLGIVEQTTLEAIAEGTDTPMKLFRQVTDKLSVLGMGDLEYWMILRGLVQGPAALVAIDGTEHSLDFREIPDFLRRHVALTPLGRDILGGKEDRVNMQGLNVWLGGVHLQGNQVRWRWDAKAGNIIEIECTI